MVVVVIVIVELFRFMTTFEKPLSATGWSQWLQVKQFGCQEVLKAWLIIFPIQDFIF